MKVLEWESEEVMVMKERKTWGTLAVATAYACWGTLTIFWDLLGEVNAVYILAQRIIWSMVFMAILMVALGKWKEILPIFKDLRKLGICFICGILVAINWGVYIYAVNSGHVLDASLGYFVEPVMVAAIGVAAFREKLSKMEKITFVFATLGLVYMVVSAGTFPVMALLIAGSFAIYGGVKKNLNISPYASLFMETLCMTPFALAFVIYGESRGMGAIGVLQGMDFALLPACGIVTSIPLLLFNVGVKEIPYYISGILMYINPTLQFFMGLFYFHESMDPSRFIAFLFIWVGILFTLYEKVQIMRMNMVNTENISFEKTRENQ